MFATLYAKSNRKRFTTIYHKTHNPDAKRLGEGQKVTVRSYGGAILIKQAIGLEA